MGKGELGNLGIKTVAFLINFEKDCYFLGLGGELGDLGVKIAAFVMNFEKDCYFLGFGGELGNLGVKIVALVMNLEKDWYFVDECFGCSEDPDSDPSSSPFRVPAFDEDLFLVTNFLFFVMFLLHFPNLTLLFLPLPKHPSIKPPKFHYP